MMIASGISVISELMYEKIHKHNAGTDVIPPYGSNAISEGHH